MMGILSGYSKQGKEQEKRLQTLDFLVVNVDNLAEGGSTRIAVSLRKDGSGEVTIAKADHVQEEVIARLELSAESITRRPVRVHMQHGNPSQGINYDLPNLTIPRGLGIGRSM